MENKPENIRLEIWLETGRHDRVKNSSIKLNLNELSLFLSGAEYVRFRDTVYMRSDTLDDNYAGLIDGVGSYKVITYRLLQ